MCYTVSLSLLELVTHQTYLYLLHIDTEIGKAFPEDQRHECRQLTGNLDWCRLSRGILRCHRMD